MTCSRASTSVSYRFVLCNRSSRHSPYKLQFSGSGLTLLDACHQCLCHQRNWLGVGTVTHNLLENNLAATGILALYTKTTSLTHLVWWVWMLGLQGCWHHQHGSILLLLCGLAQSQLFWQHTWKNGAADWSNIPALSCCHHSNILRSALPSAPPLSQ